MTHPMEEIANLVGFPVHHSFKQPSSQTRSSPPTFRTEDGQELVLRPVGDDWGCKARELGRLLGYADEGRKLVDKIGAAWKDEFVEGVDFVRKINEITDSVMRPEIVITRSGINLVCILTRKPLGRQIRRWLASDVMVQIADTGSYGQPSASPQAIAALVRDAVREALAEERREYPVALLATLNHHGHHGHQAVTKPQKPVMPRWIIEAVAEHLEEDDNGAMTYADLCPVLGPGRVWTKSDKVWLGKHLAERQFGERVRHGNIRAFCVRVKRRGPRLVA